MRADRLLSTLLLLQARGRMTATELAAELEVSVRTVYRDVESLSAAGVPVYADRGRGGGYRLLDGYRTRLTGLTEHEVRALLFAGMPGAASELGLGGVLAAAQLKLSAALPAGLRERAGEVADRFLLDAPAWFRSREEVPSLAAIAGAVWEQRRIEVRYERWDHSRVRRVLEPLGLVLKSGVWYLLAGPGTARTYRVSRVHACTVLAEGFERPAGFSLGEAWTRHEENLRARLYRGEAVVRVSPWARRMLFLLGPVVSRAAAGQTPEPDGDGWLRLRLPIESIDHAMPELLRFGGEVEVLEPAELRRRMAEAGQAISDRYGRAEGDG